MRQLKRSVHSDNKEAVETQSLLFCFGKWLPHLCPHAQEEPKTAKGKEKWWRHGKPKKWPQSRKPEARKRDRKESQSIMQQHVPFLFFYPLSFFQPSLAFCFFSRWSLPAKLRDHAFTTFFWDVETSCGGLWGGESLLLALRGPAQVVSRWSPSLK